MLRVIAAPGLRVPYETNPRTHITDAAAVDVPPTVYYRRRLASGELIEPIVAETVQTEAVPPLSDSAATTESTKSTRRKSA